MSRGGSLNSQNRRALETTGKACKCILFIKINLDTTCIGDKKEEKRLIVGYAVKSGLIFLFIFILTVWSKYCMALLLIIL